MNAEKIIRALKLPPESLINTRVPKTVLLEQAAVTPADRRAITRDIESLLWVASLKPHRIGVPAYAGDDRKYHEVVVLHLTLKGEKAIHAHATRLISLLHRSMPPLLFLVVESNAGISVSLAHKRQAHNDPAKMVLDEGFPHNSLVPDTAPARFFHDLELARQPLTHLHALYSGWLSCLLALDTWRHTGEYLGPGEVDKWAQHRHNLHQLENLEATISALRAEAEKENQVARQVELNLQIKQLEAQRAALLEELTRSRGG